jgi:helicase MOV-10
MRAKLFSDARAMVAAAEEDKNAVTVSHKEGIDFGVIGPDDSVYIDITVLKTGFRSHIVLETISIRAENSKSVSDKLTHSFSHTLVPLRFTATLAGKSRWVKHDEARTLSVKFHPAFDGEYKDDLELVFLDTSSRQRFLILRKLSAVVGSKEDHQQLKPKSAYTRPKRKLAPFQFNGPIVRSLRPPTWGPSNWTSRLPEFAPPVNLIQAAFGTQAGSNTKKILSEVKAFLPPNFTLNTYANHFQVMLYIEGEQMRRVLMERNSPHD